MNILSKKIVFLLFLLPFFTIQSWPPALENCGNTCFLNATLQAMYNIHPLTTIFDKNTNPYNQRNAPVDYYYVELIKKIIQSKDPSKAILFTCAKDQPLLQLDKSAYELMKTEACSQQDATEFIGKFLITLIFESGSLQAQIKKLFNFNLISKFVCPPLPQSSDRREHYSHIWEKIDKDHTYLSISTQNIQKQPLQTLKQCLEEYFSIEKMDDPQNPLKDKKTGKFRTDCTKQLQLTNSPEILIIALKRYASNHTIQKLDHPIYIPLQLNIAPFLGQNQNPINNHFELIGVIVQSGGVTGGHYWAYVKDKTGQWFKCDDSSITKVSITDKKVIKEIEGSPDAPTGYGLVYQKKSISKKLFDQWQNAEQQREYKALGIDPLANLKNELAKLSSSLKDLYQNLETFQKKK